MVLRFEFKERYDVKDLIEIVKILRSPEGCPWDKEQTHDSIRKDFIEEVYEAVEAIDQKDTEHLREELGDVLLQVVFHSVLEEEKGSFVFDDVADEVCKKMILRHPHVFGDVKAETKEQVLNNWEKIKMKTNSIKTIAESMDEVSRALPSLMRAEKLIKKARTSFLISSEAETAFGAVQEALDVLKEAYEDGDKELCKDELGRLLFTVAGLSEFTDSDCEKLLYDTCEEFINEFKGNEDVGILKVLEIQDLPAEADRIRKEISEKSKQED